VTEYTPDEYRAHIEKQRAAAHEIADRPAFSLIAGIGAGMLSVAADQIARLMRENDFLRAVTGNSAKECVYCGLGAENQGQCQLGFPGCSRADDQMLCREAAVAYERDCLRAELRKIIEAHEAGGSVGALYLIARKAYYGNSDP
jgi:hypothetical protein